MPRPRKWRMVCQMPKVTTFGPLNKNVSQGDDVYMTIDEFETIRLIDYSGMNQEECAAQMGIARTTVQGIYITARKKLSQALVNGSTLFISGGDYMVCDGIHTKCGKPCHKRQCWKNNIVNDNEEEK